MLNMNSGKISKVFLIELKSISFPSFSAKRIVMKRQVRISLQIFYHLLMFFCMIKFMIYYSCPIIKRASFMLHDEE